MDAKIIGAKAPHVEANPTAVTHSPVSADLKASLKARSSPDTCNSSRRPTPQEYGATYNDLGATATDNEGHDLSYRTFVNGALAGNILIDTTKVATNTIDYVATDTWGNQYPNLDHRGVGLSNASVAATTIARLGLADHGGDFYLVTFF